jgi:hypothetical protein
MNNASILRVQANGRCAEVVVDTGHVLSTGRTWLAFAKVPCSNVYTARILSENLHKRIRDAVTEARREAYRSGYLAGRRGEAPCASFDGTL